MKKNEVIEKLNELISYAEIYEGCVDLNRYPDSCVHFSHYFERTNKHYSFHLSKDYADSYHNTFWQIYSSGSIEEKFSIDYVADKLHHFMIRLKVMNESITVKNFDKFYNKLNMAKVDRQYVFFTLYGVDVNTDTPLEIGCFTLYNYNLHKEHIFKLTGYETEETFLEYHQQFKEHPVWISTAIETSDVKKAYELARYKFEVFQGVCQFFFDINKWNAYSVCVFDDFHPVFGRCFISSHMQNYEKFENDIYRHKNIDAYNLVHTVSPIFKSLIERLSSTEKNEVNERIRYAFTTYGRIIHERSDAQKFVMYITAIEALIEYNEKDLTQMITNYLSAMISDSLETYIATKKDFKITYNQRSEISHGSKVFVLKGDLAYAKAYCAELILKFITDKEIIPITKSEDLKAHLDSKVKRLEAQGV